MFRSDIFLFVFVTYFERSTRSFERVVIEGCKKYGRNYKFLIARDLIASLLNSDKRSFSIYLFVLLLLFFFKLIHFERARKEI